VDEEEEEEECLLSLPPGQKEEDEEERFEVGRVLSLNTSLPRRSRPSCAVETPRRAWPWASGVPPG